VGSTLNSIPFGMLELNLSALCRWLIAPKELVGRCLVFKPSFVQICEATKLWFAAQRQVAARSRHRPLGTTFGYYTNPYKTRFADGARQR
jgi:hypothetical protein